jgi:hypothetical protein
MINTLSREGYLYANLTIDHGLIIHKNTKTKCRLYWEIIKFTDWRYIQSIQSCWYFRPRFVTYCPSNFLSGSPPPLPKVKVLYIQTVCGCEGVGSVELCWRPYSAGVFRTYKLLYHPKQKPRRRGGQRQINRQITTFGIAFYTANLSTLITIHDGSTSMAFLIWMGCTINRWGEFVCRRKVFLVHKHKNKNIYHLPISNTCL